jgi:hypothetical protein
VTDPTIPPFSKLKLVILYALRYQKSQTSNIATLINLLLNNGIPAEEARVRPSRLFPISGIHFSSLFF